MKVTQTSILGLFLCPLSCLANVSSEIDHLLKFVEQSGCQYERNGHLHSAVEARAHITKKYNYYRSDIESAEDFVKYAATKSTLSGKFYKIHCPEEQVALSKDWLLFELGRFRQNKSQALSR
ncbi:DUF5329 domain-containing protein [Pseudoalteromonas sp. SMS1]|uniref:DUF5329 family protein n=1 Tax=Pseudoalteromonas sp. SMS1 TaxID=2908894 RepID=UPI001F163C9A|nr:DUF5329 family protein [Pseudoalteromonas sp. SMS1]MCF2859800.1 DUF5329 domain-containing protein [Pseudoalteromonas sp. SMS1]